MYVKTGKVFQVYRNFPLDFHANAPAASLAAICAGDQDPQLFWDMHDWLFQNQQTWQDARDAAAQFRTQAVALGADGAKFDACLADPKTQAQLDKDMQDATALGVRGTPAFFIYRMENGQPQGDPRPLSGALPFAQFSQVLDEILAQ
jgi:protein-disulfide isomerase